MFFLRETCPLGIASTTSLRVASVGAMRGVIRQHAVLLPQGGRRTSRANREGPAQLSVRRLQMCLSWSKSSAS